MRRLLRIDKEEFTKAVTENTTIIGAIRALGLPETSYDTIHKYVIIYEVNTSHWKPHVPSSETIKKRKETARTKATVEEIFSTSSTFDRAYVKRKIIKGKLLPYECHRCNITEWQNSEFIQDLLKRDWFQENYFT